jgi:ankyrin repeat protein
MRRLADLDPTERGRFGVLVRALVPGYPAFKTRPLPQDIAVACVAAVLADDAAALSSLLAVASELEVKLPDEALDLAGRRLEAGDHLLPIAIDAGARAALAVLLPLSDPDRPSGWDGRRPLHVALAARDGESIRALLAHGVDPDLPDSRGESPRERAARLAAVFPDGPHLLAGAALPRPDASPKGGGR